MAQGGASAGGFSSPPALAPPREGTGMNWAGLYPWAAISMATGLLLAAVPAGAQTTATPTARPTAAATATAVPTPSFVPAPPTLQPVANDDPRFGAVQAIYAPQPAANAGVKWERLI